MAALRVKTNPETSSTVVFMLKCTGTGSAGVLARQVVSPICFEDARDRAGFPCTSQVSLWAGLLGMEFEAKLIRSVFFLCSRHYDRARRLCEHGRSCVRGTAVAPRRQCARAGVGRAGYFAS